MMFEVACSTGKDEPVTTEVVYNNTNAFFLNERTFRRCVAGNGKY